MAEDNSPLIIDAFIKESEYEYEIYPYYIANFFVIHWLCL